MPFAGYKDFDACTRANQDKDDPGCLRCGYRSMGRRSLSQHYRRQHPEPVITTCAVCETDFEHRALDVRVVCGRSCAGRLTVPLAAAGVTAEGRSCTGRKRAARLWKNKERVMAERKARGHYQRVSVYMKAGGAAKAKLASSRGGPSRPQCEMYRLVQKMWPEAKLEFPIGSRIADVAVPSLQLALEYDGSYWHQDVDADRQRDLELAELGWETRRFRSLSEVEDFIGRVA